MSYDDPSAQQPQQYPGNPAQQPQIPAPGYGYDQQPPGYPQNQPGFAPPPGYGQAPGYGPVPGFAPPPPPKKRTGLFVGIGVVVGVAAIGLTYALTSGGSNKPADQAGLGQPTSPSSLSAPSSAAASPSADASTAAAASGAVTVPASAGGLTEMTGSSGDAVTQAMKKADASNSTLSSAEFGAYEKTGTSSYFGDLTLVPLATSSDLHDVYSLEGASSALQQISSSTLTKSATEPSAEPNGAMTCGLIVDPSITLRACMWMDANEYGLAALPESLSNAEAAQYSAAIWKASEGS